MLWRAWSFVSGAPVGVLVALACGAQGLPALGGAALAAGLLSWGAAAWVGGGARAARAAGAGWASLAAVAAALLQLPPGPAVWSAAQAVVSLVVFDDARRRGDPAERPRSSGLLAAGLAWLAIGAAAVVLAAVAGAWDEAPPEAPGSAEAIYDLDAAVATRPLPRCADDGGEVRVLRASGARPRLAPDGALWFDARAGDGRRQIHRLDPATGAAVCRTCDEAGHNLRPAPGRAGVLFETDRHAAGVHPADTDLHLLRGGATDGEPSRRLTFGAGAHGHAVWDPAGGVVWSRRVSGHAVVRATIQSGHGSLALGPPTPIERGGARFVAPEAWSPDARSLVTLRGNPFAPLRATLRDPATGEERPLRDDVVPGGVAFSADGAVLALAASTRARAAGALPAALGALLQPLAWRLDRDGVLFRGTSLYLGERDGALRRQALPDVEAWGAPTGVSLSPDGLRVYLGQRAADGSERLLEIRRRCS
ncbi:MAG: hypothetical protein ACQGVC_25795 [Myxococcota bacterium]